MASSQSKSNSKNDASLRSSDIWEKTMKFGEEILEFGNNIVELIKANPLPAAAIMGTVLVPPAAYAVNQQVNVAFQELGGNQQEVLNHFLDKTAELLNQEIIRATINQPDDNSKKLLKANSFTALRSLDGRGKGRLLRFLSEAELIKANQPNISLSGADLREVNLQNAWLPAINLDGAYVLNGNLQNVNLKEAHLAGINLTDANLTDANLTGANLTGANLTDANLTGANLDVGEAIQSGAIFCRTTMPNGQLSTQSCRGIRNIKAH